MHENIHQASSSIWWMFMLCSIILWLYNYREKRNRRKVKKELPKRLQAWQSSLLGMSIFTSLCQLPLPFLAPLAIWCYGVTAATGLFSAWIGIRHVYQALRSSASMSPEQFAEKALAWEASFLDRAKPSTIYSRFFYTAITLGILTALIGIEEILLELYPPPAISQGVRTLALSLLGATFVILLVILWVLIPSWERQAKRERECLLTGRNKDI